MFFSVLIAYLAANSLLLVAPGQKVLSRGLPGYDAHECHPQAPTPDCSGLWKGASIDRQTLGEVLVNSARGTSWEFSLLDEYVTMA